MDDVIAECSFRPSLTSQPWLMIARLCKTMKIHYGPPLSLYCDPEVLEIYQSRIDERASGVDYTRIQAITYIRLERKHKLIHMNISCISHPNSHPLHSSDDSSIITGKQPSTSSINPPKPITINILRLTNLRSLRKHQLINYRLIRIITP